MAIRTPYVALCDLAQQLIAPASCMEERNSLEFVHSISVVELQHKRVALTTIDAGMRAQIVIDLATEISAAGALPPPVGGRIPCLVSSVVLPGVYAHAEPTPSSTQSANLVTTPKVLERSSLTAAGASAKS